MPRCRSCTPTSTSLVTRTSKPRPRRTLLTQLHKPLRTQRQLLLLLDKQPSSISRRQRMPHSLSWLKLIHL
ncbi:MAG: hypothetical protein ACK56F_28855, partial [bacterium]